MEDIVGFKKKINSYIKRSEEGSVSLTFFLDEAEISTTKELVKYNDTVKAYFYGGIINSDRQRCVLSSYDVEEDDFKIKVFQIVYNKKFYDMNHRSILGSIMSLGIKRECVGDILVTENKDAYIVIASEIESYILENFHYVGRCAISLKEIDYPLENEIRYESKTYFVSSLRLDVIICAIYGFSRNEVLEILERQEVFVNQILNQNPSHIIKENDLISVRHKGKFVVSNIGGSSRSGRIIVELSKRV